MAKKQNPPPSDADSSVVTPAPPVPAPTEPAAEKPLPKVVVTNRLNHPRWKCGVLLAVGDTDLTKRWPDFSAAKRQAFLDDALLTVTVDGQTPAQATGPLPAEVRDARRAARKAAKAAAKKEADPAATPRA